jgi:hypothetical protein
MSGLMQRILRRRDQPRPSSEAPADRPPAIATTPDAETPTDRPPAIPTTPDAETPTDQPPAIATTPDAETPTDQPPAIPTTPDPGAPTAAVPPAASAPSAPDAPSPSPSPVPAAVAAAPDPGAQGTPPTGTAPVAEARTEDTTAAPAALAEVSAPAGVPADAPAEPSPSFRERGRLRRRLRFLRRLRELGFRDLGGLVFDQHRFRRPDDELVRGKVTALAAVDAELRALERVLADRRPITELREAGISACARCGAIIASDARFCSSCGTPVGGAQALPDAVGPGS